MLSSLAAAKTPAAPVSPPTRAEPAPRAAPGPGELVITGTAVLPAGSAVIQRVHSLLAACTPDTERQVRASPAREVSYASSCAHESAQAKITFTVLANLCASMCTLNTTRIS